MGQTQGKTVAHKQLTSKEHKQRLENRHWRHEVGPDHAPEGRREAPFQLRKVTLATFLDSQLRDIIVIPSTATVGEAMQILQDNKIHSAPVADNSNGSSNGKYKGVLNIRDLAGFVLQHGSGSSGLPNSSATEVVVDSLLSVLDANKTITVHRQDTLYNVVKMMNKHRVHRLMVVNKDEQLVGVISQFGLLRVLYENIDALYNSPDSPISAFGLRKEVVTVQENDMLLEAVERMTSLSLSVVGVVNTSGKLVGEFSMAEMRALESEQANRLTEFRLTDVITDQDVLTIEPTQSLREIIELLYERSKRRAFITEGVDPPTHYGQIVGVVTLTDLLNLLFNSPMGVY